MNFERQYYEADSFWAGDAISDPDNLRRFAKTCDLIPSDVQSVADIGCGNGRFGAHILSSRPEIDVVGVDRSEAALRHVTFKHRQAEIDSLPFADRSIDCVTCLQVVEHLPVPVYKRAIEELSRVAKTYIIIDVPRNEQIEKNVTTCPACRTIFNVDLHLRSFTDNGMSGLLGPDFALQKTVYPMGKRRRLLIDDLLGKIGKWRQGDLGFLSPVCPVCGYSEGDRTHLSVGHGASDPRAGSGLAKRLLKFWPTYFEKGYEVALLFKRV